MYTEYGENLRQELRNRDQVTDESKAEMLYQIDEFRKKSKMQIPDIERTIIKLAEQPQEAGLWARLLQRVAGWGLGVAQACFRAVHESMPCRYWHLRQSASISLPVLIHARSDVLGACFRCLVGDGVACLSPARLLVDWFPLASQQKVLSHTSQYWCWYASHRAVACTLYVHTL